MTVATYEGCAAETIPKMTLWQRFFPEPVMPEASFHDVSLANAGYGPSIRILCRLQRSLIVSFD